MRVTHIITRLIIGGAQENTLFNCEDLHRLHGDDVTLITGPGLGPEGSLMDRARGAGFRIIEVDAFRRSIHPLRDWSSYRTIRKTLGELRPDIVHTHSSKAGIIGRRSAWSLGIPAVHTIHGASFHTGQSPLAYNVYRWLERRAAPWTAAFISVCDAMTEHYVRAGIAPRERFTTIYSGMDVEPFLHPPRPREEVRRELDLQPHQVAIAKVARLFHLKGHEFLIRAAKTVCDRYPEAVFVLIGDGLLRGSIEREIAALGIADRFRFTGLVPPSHIPELIHAADIVAHTSVWEGLARVLPQALISGRPVVSYDIDGAREVCRPGETGFLLPPESVAELADALGQLIASPTLRERFGQTGRARFTDQFRHEFMTQQIRAVYERVLSRS